MKYLWLALGCLLITALVAYNRLSTPPVLLNPLSSVSPSRSNNMAPPAQIMGFLPYWNLNKLNPDTIKNLSHLLYFGITVDRTGHLVTDDIGYRRFLTNFTNLQHLTQANQVKFILVIKMFNDENIFPFLNDTNAQALFFKEFNQFAASYPVSGYNLDFEANTATDTATINQFTEFVRSFRHELPQNSELSIDIYSSAATSPKLWNLSQLAPLTDSFIVMAYDYTRPSSSTPGPVAPLFPSFNQSHALIPDLKAISVYLPPEKIVIGLPLYGYEWTTATASVTDPALHLPARVASLERIYNLINSNHLSVYKNPLSFSSRIILPFNDRFSQIYFDDLSSLKTKAALVHMGFYRGLALWALGYEGETNIWVPLIE